MEPCLLFIQSIDPDMKSYFSFIGVGSDLEPCPSFVQPIDSDLEPCFSFIGVDSDLEPCPSFIQPIDSDIKSYFSFIRSVDSDLEPCFSFIQPIYSDMEHGFLFIRPVDLKSEAYAALTSWTWTCTWIVPKQRAGCLLALHDKGKYIYRGSGFLGSNLIRPGSGCWLMIWSWLPLI